MKTAEEYYQPVYGKNLSRYLRNLIKERQLNEPRPGQLRPDRAGPKRAGEDSGGSSAPPSYRLDAVKPARGSWAMKSSPV